MDCYNFKQYIFNDGLFDVDATFIIYLEGSERIKNIKKQLDLYNPSKIVYIVYNKGYKKCKKENIINSSQDLAATFLEIFKFSQKNNMKRILIFEDDFDFLYPLKQEDVNNVNDFLIKNQNYIYYLGTVPYIRIPLNTTTSKVYVTGGTHACIYSQEFINYALSYKSQISDWDVFVNEYDKRYMYNKPLCYQTFPDTENSKHWGFYGYLSHILYKFLNMDKIPEPGYTIFYYLSFILPLIFLILFIFFYTKRN